MLKKENHLQNVLESHRMAHIQSLVDKHLKRRDEIKEVLEKEYIGKIYTPSNSGSFAKHTAINIKFDLDIIIPFKRDSFTTIEEMFDDVYNVLIRLYNHEATVRKQKVSIGIIFNSDTEGDIINIDVVPGRELSQDNYPESKDLNLYFNEDKWGFKKGTYTKTNIQSQIDHIKSKDNERKIIRLLKIWKHTNNEKYKSFLFELITIKAFKQKNESGNLWDKLKFVMSYIRDKMKTEDFTLIDPGNTSNDIIKTMNQNDRDSLSRKFNNIIERIEENSNNIKTYFPINMEYEEDTSSDATYGIKGEDITPSIPSNTQRFG